MKNLVRLFVACVPFLLPLAAMGQAMEGIGPRVGVGFNDTSIDTALRTDAPSSDKTSFVVGLAAEWHIPASLSLDAAALYTRRETTLHFAAADNLPAITSRYKVDFIEIPIDLRYNFGNSGFQPYVFAGPNFGIRINAKAEIGRASCRERV